MLFKADYIVVTNFSVVFPDILEHLYKDLPHLLWV